MVPGWKHDAAPTEGGLLTAYATTVVGIEKNREEMGHYSLECYYTS